MLAMRAGPGLLIVVALAAGALLFQAATPAAARSSYLGDANCDGLTNSVDAALVLQHEARLVAELPCDNADSDRNSTIDARDAALILQYSAGLLPMLDAPCFDPTLSNAAQATLPGLADETARIAFVCQGLIYTMHPDGSDQQLVTQPAMIDWAHVHLNRDPREEPPRSNEIHGLQLHMNLRPKWLSNDRIVFASIRDTLRLSAESSPSQARLFEGATELYASDEDGTGLVRLTDYNFTSGSYPGSFDPSVACLGRDFCHAGLLWILPQSVSPDGDNVVVGVAEIHFSECCFYGGVYHVPDNNLQRIALSPGEPDSGGSLGLGYAPDGERAAVYVWRGNNLGGPYAEELDIRDLATGADTELLRAGDGEDLPGSLGTPAWSPTDDRIAFCGQAGYDQPSILYVIDADGSRAPQGLVTLASGTNESYTFLQCAPSWSRDGRFITVDSGDGSVLVVDAATGTSAPIALGEQPNWHP